MFTFLSINIIVVNIILIHLIKDASNFTDVFFSYKNFLTALKKDLKKRKVIKTLNEINNLLYMKTREQYSYFQINIKKMVQLKIGGNVKKIAELIYVYNKTKC